MTEITGFHFLCVSESRRIATMHGHFATSEKLLMTHKPPIHCFRASGMNAADRSDSDWFLLSAQSRTIPEGGQRQGIGPIYYQKKGNDIIRHYLLLVEG